MGLDRGKAIERIFDSKLDPLRLALESQNLEEEFSVQWYISLHTIEVLCPPLQGNINTDSVRTLKTYRKEKNEEQHLHTACHSEPRFNAKRTAKQLSQDCSNHPTFTVTYPVTALVIGALQMPSQLVSSIFLCFSLPSGTWRGPCLSIP